MWLFCTKNKRSMRRVAAGCMILCVLVTGLLYGVAKAELKESYATEMVAEETGTDAVVSGESAMPENAITSNEPAFTGKEFFVVFVCCFFSLALCLVLALYGNPNDRLKDKYRRARKQELAREKRKKEMEARAAKRAAEDAEYEKKLAQYEADMKEYEEAKAAKAAAKAAKKEAKRSRGTAS